MNAVGDADAVCGAPVMELCLAMVLSRFRRLILWYLWLRTNTVSLGISYRTFQMHIGNHVWNMVKPTNSNTK